MRTPHAAVVLILLGVILPMRLQAQDAPELHRVLVQDYEQPDNPARVWVVNIPNEAASVGLSGEHASDSRQALKLGYRFTADGQYLGVVTPVRLAAPIHSLRFMLHGDGSGCSYGVYLTDATGETHKFQHHGEWFVDFVGWREITVDNIGDWGEHWGGNRDGKIDYPVREVVFEIGTPGKPAQGEIYFDRLTVDTAATADELLGGVISVASPDYGGDVSGDTVIKLNGRGFETLSVRSWKPGGRFGEDALVGTVQLDEHGDGEILFPADEYPHGPVVVRISGENATTTDNCYLQLYNTGGVDWNQGAPGTPPAARGMTLVFEDDFESALSISRTGEGATYGSHKVLWGDFSGIPFADHENKDTTPFLQRDTYLRIRADEAKNTTGLIASIDQNGDGITARAPCYFECRFVAQSATGTWPAFWVMTNEVKGVRGVTDELDVIEAYGGEGPGNPNAQGKYMIATHYWGQEGEQDGFYGAIDLPNLDDAGGAGWHESPHVYGVLIGIEDTVYYCDDIEVARHKTARLSKVEPFYFYINLAVGGNSGWPRDLSRYAGIADMYVDYVRVYQGE